MSFQPASPRSHLPLVVALVVISVVAVVAIAVVAFLIGRLSAARTPAPLAPLPATAAEGGPTASNRYLDGSAAEKGVTKVVSENYGAKKVANTTCPDNEPVEAGHTFVCTLSIDGSPSTVTVTFVDDSGTYEVSLPSRPHKRD